MSIGRKSTVTDQLTSKFRKWWRRQMNCPTENTFPSRPSPSLCNVQAAARQLLLQKPSAFYWIDTSISAVRKTVSRFLRENRARWTRSLPFLPRLVRSHLLICNSTPGQHKHYQIYFGKAECGLIGFLG